MSFFLTFSLFAYYGDVDKFLISENSICLNAPEEASQAYISLASQVSNNAIWQSHISFLFLPTSSNYLKWYLMADSSNVNASSNAYYLMFGGSKRTISFYYLNKGKSTLIWQEKEKLLNNTKNHLDIKVRRTDLEEWQIEYVLNDTISATCNFYHSQLNYSSYFGWHCVYTKTRSKGFCFSEIFVKGEEVAKPRLPKFGELLINEILFNPEADGVDFIEIINVSDTIFDLTNIQLGNKKQTYSLPSYILYPDSVVAVTKDTLILCNQYDCLFSNNIIQVDKMLPLPNDSGYVRILCDTILIDSLFYKSSMHHVLLNNVEGISLQRLENTSWGSSSSIVKATPGYHFYIAQEDNEDIITDNEGDFFKLSSNSVHINSVDISDNLILAYYLSQSQRVSVQVFSLNGYPVYTILESQLLSGEGKLFWDGRGENLSVLPVGIYVILIEFYTSENKYLYQKFPVAIIP